MATTNRTEVGIDRSAASTWWKNRDKIKEMDKVSKNGDISRIYPRKLEPVVEALYRAILMEREMSR